MKITLRQQITQFAHVLQTSLFPVLNEELGELTEPAQRLVATLEMNPLARFVPCSRGWMGRPSKDRLAIASAFVAKAVYGFNNTSLDSCWMPSPAIPNCGASAAGERPSRCRMNPRFPEPLTSSRAWNCRSSSTRL